MSFLKKLSIFKNTDEATKVAGSVDEQVISDSYKNLEEEINSLRLYDKGQKKIDAPDLKRAVQRVQ